LLVGVAGFAAVTGDFVAGATLIKGLAALGAAFAPAGDGLAPGLAEVWLCDWGVPSASFSFATFCCSAALSLSCVLWMRLGFCPKAAPVIIIIVVRRMPVVSFIRFPYRLAAGALAGGTKS